MKSKKEPEVKPEKEAPEQKRTRLGKKRVLLALEKSLGIVSQACKTADVARTAYYDWLKEDKEFAAAVKDIEEQALDFAESALFRLIKGVQLPEDKVFVNAKGTKTVVKTIKVYAPDAQAVMFYLKTKGKTRGYILSNEIEIPDGITEFKITRKLLNSKDDLSKK